MFSNNPGGSGNSSKLIAPIFTKKKPRQALMAHPCNTGSNTPGKPVSSYQPSRSQQPQLSGYNHSNPHSNQHSNFTSKSTIGTYHDNSRNQPAQTMQCQTSNPHSNQHSNFTSKSTIGTIYHDNSRNQPTQTMQCQTGRMDSSVYQDPAANKNMPGLASASPARNYPGYQNATFNRNLQVSKSVPGFQDNYQNTGSNRNAELARAASTGYPNNTASASNRNMPAGPSPGYKGQHQNMSSREAPRSSNMNNGSNWNNTSQTASQYRPGMSGGGFTGKRSMDDMFDDADPPPMSYQLPNSTQNQTRYPNKGSQRQYPQPTQFSYNLPPAPQINMQPSEPNTLYGGAPYVPTPTLHAQHSYGEAFTPSNGTRTPYTQTQFTSDTPKKTPVKVDSGTDDSRLRQKMPGPDKTLRVLTATIQGTKHWSQYKDKLALIFEVFGIVNSAVTTNIQTSSKEFILKDSKDSVKCVFFEIDRKMSKTTRGQWYRCVGNLNSQRDLFKIVSIRPATQTEQRLHKVQVAMSDKVMRVVITNIGK